MLKKGRKFSDILSNIQTLISEKPGKSRSKAIKTLAKKKGISLADAKQYQSRIIAFKKATNKDMNRRSKNDNGKGVDFT